MTAAFTTLDDFLTASVREAKSPTRPSSAIAAHGTASVSIAILTGGDVVEHTISTTSSHTSSTQFAAGSISKPVTALCTIKLVNDGVLSLDEPIVNRLPQSAIEALSPTPTAAALLKQVTVRHLLSHTAGFSVQGFPGYPHSGSAPSPSKVLAGAYSTTSPAVEFWSLPGLVYSYSGGGWVALQLVLESVTGKSFEHLMRDTLFKPLKMAKSTFKTPSIGATDAGIAPAHWTGYTPAEVLWRQYPESAAAGLWSTAGDIMRFAHAIQRSLAGAPGALLRPELAREMLTVVKSNMSLGFCVDERSFGHSGGTWPGSAAFFSAFDSELGKLNEGNQKMESKPSVHSVPSYAGVCVMTNSSQGPRAMWECIHALSYTLQWPEVASFGQFQDATIPLARHGQEICGGWSEYVGTWDMGLQIKNEEGKMVVLWNRVGIDCAPAAIPSYRYEHRAQSIDVVLDGVRMMLRLGWDEEKVDTTQPGPEERAIELWIGATGRTTVLRRASV